MKRFHLHLPVGDLQASVACYPKLFAAEPSRVEADYAKWMLEDPCINFAGVAPSSVPGFVIAEIAGAGIGVLIDRAMRTSAKDAPAHPLA
ncbi:hypothetical protein SBBP1_990016 [Burkholderiales bacterium]|nr:hypothetical protein SBBP1_990016 [Burkholderiales bacterium]